MTLLGEELTFSVDHGYDLSEDSHAQVGQLSRYLPTKPIERGAGIGDRHRARTRDAYRVSPTVIVLDIPALGELPRRATGLCFPYLNEAI